MGLEEDFQAAVDMVSNKINKTLSNEELLEVYALYKQASIGDCNTSRPGMMDFKVSLTFSSEIWALTPATWDMSDLQSEIWCIHNEQSGDV